MKTGHSKLGKLRKVLVTDDSEVFRRICRKSISNKYSCEVLEAKNGLEAMEHFSQTPDIGLILLSVNMPTMNGVQFMEAVQMKIKHSPLPVIVTGKKDQKAQIVKCISLGASGYIFKPLHIHDLFSLIDKIFKV